MRFGALIFKSWPEIGGASERNDQKFVLILIGRLSMTNDLAGVKMFFSSTFMETNIKIKISFWVPRLSLNSGAVQVLKKSYLIEPILKTGIIFP